MEKVFEMEKTLMMIGFGSFFEEFPLFGLEVSHFVENHFLGIFPNFHLVKFTFRTKKSIIVNELFSNLLISNSPKTAIVIIEITKPP